MADRHTTIFGDQIDATIAGLGIAKDGSDNFQVDIDTGIFEFSGNDLTIKDGGISEAKLTEDYIKTTEVDDDTLEFASGDILQVKALGIDTAELANEAVTEGKIDIFNAPTDGEYLKFTDANGMEWADIDGDYVSDSDVIANEIPTGLINSSNVNYTLANTPVAGTVQVYLNGLLQAPGTGLDYTVSGTTITFSKAPRTGSDLYVSYIIV